MFANLWETGPITRVPLIFLLLALLTTTFLCFSLSVVENLLSDKSLLFLLRHSSSLSGAQQGIAHFCQELHIKH